MGEGVSGAFEWLNAGLEAIESEGMSRSLKVSLSASLPEIILDGRQVLQFSSNNYLGLATHPRVLAAAERALREFGAGSGASRLVSGTQAPHADLEAAIAELKGAEAALVFATGSMANQGLISSLAGPGDLVILDKGVHATLYDGARLSGAEIKRFPHQSLEHLAYLLEEAGKGRKVLIAVESVYSMDGDIAPLPALLELAEKHGAMLVADEAHSTGVLGRRGAGILEHFGLAWHPNLALSGTLSKALGSLGGFVAGPKPLIQWLVNKSRSFIFATALPAASAAAALESLKVLREEPERLQRLWKNRESLAAGLEARGWNLGQSASPILPLIVGKAEAASSLQSSLWEQGIYVPAIRPPTVPAASCRLRASLTSEHSAAHIERLLNAMGNYGNVLAD